MASESADPALSPGASSFMIAGKIWRLGVAIHSTGVDAVKKKMVQTFGDAFATAMVEGVMMGRGSGLKYCVKWTNLSEELICEYRPNHRIFRDLSKERPQKVPKIHGPHRLSLDTARSSPAGPNTTDVLELHPSSGEDSEPYVADPQNPAISSLQIGDNLWRADPALDLQDPRFGLPLANHRPQIRFPQHIPHGIDPTELECFEFFMYQDLISHLLFIAMNAWPIRRSI